MSHVTTHVNSVFNSCSYRIGNCVVDAGDVWEGFAGASALLLTHAHFDHMYGVNQLVALNPDIRIYTNARGAEMLLNAKRNLSAYHEAPVVLDSPGCITLVEDGDTLSVDGLSVKAVFTPGHNGSCITWVTDDAVFTGDSYIPGLKTVTNLPGSDRQAAPLSEQTILQLAATRSLYPGHSV